MIRSQFIIFMLNTEQSPAQYIPLLGCKSLPSTWQLPHGFNEPFFRCAAIPLLESPTLQVLSPVEM